MESAFTIGLLGGCGDGAGTAQYFGKIVLHFQKNIPRIRILMPITSKGERSVASYLLEQKRNNSGLEVCVVLTSRQWQDYLQSASGEEAAACNRIIAAADRYEVVPGSVIHFSLPPCSGCSSSGATTLFSTSTAPGSRRHGIYGN